MFRQQGVLLAALGLCATLPRGACGEEIRRIPSGQSQRRNEQPSMHRERMPEKEGAVPNADARWRISATTPVRDAAAAAFLQQQLQSSREHRRRAQSSCDESSPFSITSSYYPDAEGCYYQTTFETDTTYEVVYTPSGQPEVGQMWIHSDGVSGSTTIVWWLSFVTATTEDGFVESSADLCSSNQSADLHHPADVLTWQCGTDFTVSADEFSVACGGGCSDSSSSTVPAPAPTPAPAAITPEPASPEGSCGESSPFSITSSYYPDAEGCYYQTTFETDTTYEVVYTPSGQPEVGQMWIHPDGIEGYDDIVWWVSFVTATTEDGFVESSADVCSSYGAAALYHPADVLGWRCGTDILVSANEFSAACGGGCSQSSSSAVPGVSPAPQLAVETPGPTEAATPELPEAATPQPTEFVTPGPTSGETPEPKEFESSAPTQAVTPEPTVVGTPGPAEASTPNPVPSTSGPTASTPAPMLGSRDLEMTPSPTLAAAPVGAIVLPSDTPAPVEESEQQQGNSAFGRYHFAWSVLVTGSAGVVAAISLAVGL